jgi:hypothetical protein
MADTSGMADLRGIDIQKLATGFAEEEIVLRRYCTVAPTSAREIRWYQKTAGFLVGTTTSGMTTSNLTTSNGSQPAVIENSITRNTSYVRKYFASSPIIADEDIKDSDPDIFAVNVLDITRAVLHEEDLRIWNVLTENQSAVNINTVATNAPWNTASYTGVNAVEDILDMKTQIRTYGYDPEGAILMLSPLDHKSLLTWLIDGKGSSIPAFSSARVGDGVVQEILGVKVVVSTIVTADYACLFVPNRAVKVKEFTPITTGIVEHVGVGKEIRIWLESEAINENPRAVCLLTNTQA